MPSKEGALAAARGDSCTKSGGRLAVLLRHVDRAPPGVARHSSSAAGRGAATPAALAALEAQGRRALDDLNKQLAEPARPRLGPQRTRSVRSSRMNKSSLQPGVPITKQLDKIEDWTKGLDFDVARHLPGPLNDPARTRLDVLAEVGRSGRLGASHKLWEEMQRRYCADGMSSNFVLPMVAFRGGQPPVLTQQIILAHPGDCMRIARDHVKKQPGFSAGLLGTGVIATTDNAHWKLQRDGLIQAFHPMASLAKIYPRVVARAESCAERLAGLAAGGKPVDIGEFLLHEALAQLQLGLFGFPEEFMDATNVRFRRAMAGQGGPGEAGFTRKFMDTLLDMMKAPAHTSPGEALHGVPLHGPLSRVIETTTPGDDTLTKIGNAFIFAFAGHDTTGHTMTWLVYELAQRPDLQRRLQREVDDFFAALGGRQMAYRDLAQLKFMTRCVMETLRLWNAVPNGTFRELQHDDWVHGEGGKRVRAPKGTYVQVTSWLRHRDPKLWGPDAHVFNPDREFHGAELWDGRGFAAYSPSTERFSPFTFQPRDCIGKNFAQSEMRAILCHILHRFSFELAHPEHVAGQRGVNYGTMGPQDLTKPIPPRGRVPTGLLVRVIPRR